MTRIAAGLCGMSATELARAIRSKQVSSREVVEAHLRRIEEMNPAVNAVTVVLGERALEAAQAADHAAAVGGDLPPLHGVPFTIKGNIDLAGIPTTHGIKALAAAYPAEDAPVVERMRAAGAIPIGHTNLPDFAIGWHTDSELWGATINPWDRSRTPGASSGGEAAALATGMTPLGFGNDTLGSLRWPAQCCGVTALKPTLGRIPHSTTVEPVDAPISNQLLGVNGPLARRIADLRAALAATAGPTWRDPWTVPAPLRGPEPARPIRVAVVTDPAGQGTIKQVRDGVRAAARALADAGYAVDEAEPPSVARAARTHLDIFLPPVLALWPAMEELFRARTRKFVSALIDAVGETDQATVIQSFMTRQALQRAWGEFGQTHSLIVAPVYTGLPFEVGADLTVPEVADIVGGMRMVLAVNVLGLPAVALPVGIADGLPQSVQVIGPRYREDLCLDAAAAIESRLGVLTPIDPRLTGRQGPMTTPADGQLRPGRIQVRDASLYVNVTGTGYPLLLMHGGPGADHLTLLPFRELADQFTLIFYDHRCNGRSQGAPISSMTFENLTADADALRRSLGYDRWAVLGHSFGGHVALEYALRYPGSVSHLVLVDTGGDSRWSQRNAAELLASRGYSPEKTELVRRWFNGEFEPRQMALILMRIGSAYYSRPSLSLVARELIRGEWRSKMRPEAMIFGGRHLLKGWTVMDRLGEIPAPTLIVAGRDDFIFPPEHQRDLVAGIPHARLELIERAGHNPHAEQPAQVMRAIRDFLAA